jgi:hypothetical protein
VVPPGPPSSPQPLRPPLVAVGAAPLFDVLGVPAVNAGLGLAVDGRPAGRLRVRPRPVAHLRLGRSGSGRRPRSSRRACDSAPGTWRAWCGPGGRPPELECPGPPERRRASSGFWRAETVCARKLGEYIEHRRERERLLPEARGGRRSEQELLDSAWSDAPLAMRPAAALTLRAQLEKLPRRAGFRRGWTPIAGARQIPHPGGDRVAPSGSSPTRCSCARRSREISCGIGCSWPRWAGAPPHLAPAGCGLGSGGVRPSGGYFGVPTASARTATPLCRRGLDQPVSKAGLRGATRRQLAHS